MSKDLMFRGLSYFGIYSFLLSNSCLISMSCLSTWMIQQFMRLATSKRSVYVTLISSVIYFSFICTLRSTIQDSQMASTYLFSRNYKASRREIKHSSCFFKSFYLLGYYYSLIKKFLFSLRTLFNFFQELNFITSYSSLSRNLSIKFQVNRLIFLQVDLWGALCMGCITAFIYFYEQNFILLCYLGKELGFLLYQALFYRVACFSLQSFMVEYDLLELLQGDFGVPSFYTQLPSSSILYPNSSIQLIRRKQSFVNNFFNKFCVFQLIALVYNEKVISLLLIVLISMAIDLDSYGQIPNSISYKTTPSDHMSALVVQFSPLKTSGAMQIGEPSMVLAICSPGLSPLQKPKSPNLTFPLLKSIFSGFKSLCMILKRLSTLKASNNCRNTFNALFSVKFPSLFIKSIKVPPLQYSYTKQQLFLV